MSDEYHNAMVKAVQEDFDRRGAICDELAAERDREAAQYIDDEIALIEFRSPQEAEIAFYAAVEKLKAATVRFDELLELLIKKQNEVVNFMKDNPVTDGLGAE